MTPDRNGGNVIPFPNQQVGELSLADRQVLDRVAPLLNEVHDRQQTAFGRFTDDFGMRHGIQVQATEYMNQYDRNASVNAWPGMWDVIEYNAEGQVLSSARLHRMTAREGARYEVHVDDLETGDSRLANPAELAYHISLLGRLADIRDQSLAIAAKQYESGLSAVGESARRRPKRRITRALTALFTKAA